MGVSAEDREDDPGSLLPFLSMVEKHGSVVLLSRTLEQLAPLDARVALHTRGVLTAAEAAVSWPCEVRGCSREIRSNYDGAPRPLVAVCFQVPAACVPIELGFEDISQQRVSPAALVSLSCTLLGATEDPASVATLDEVHPLGGTRAPVLVATTRSPARDVFWTGTPRDIELAAFCARRERVQRRTLLLVPTARWVPLEVLARYARGEKVEVLSLADLLTLRGSEIVLATGESAPAPLFSTRPPPGMAGIAAQLGATRWEDIRITMVDENTVRIEANGQSLLRTFVEMGFVDKRKKKSVTSVTGWKVLLLLCAKGVLRPSEYQQFGKQWAAKKGIESMRAQLQLAFGLQEDPLLSYLTRSGWRPRFRVNPVRL